MSSAEISALSKSNLAGVLLRAKQLGVGEEDDFTFAADEVKNLTAIDTPYPCVVEVRVKLASGELTIQADVNATGTYAAEDATTGVISNTANHYLRVVTTSANKKVALRCTSGTTGEEAVVAELEAKVLAVLAEKDNGIEVRSSFNAVSAQDGVWTSAEEEG